MFRPRSDLSLEQDAAKRFLPWLIALIVYLAALALAGLMVLSTAASGWDRGLTGTLTVQIPPAASKNGAADSNSGPKARVDKARIDKARVDKALEVLRATPGVAHAKAVSREEMLAPPAPWLGSGPFAEGLWPGHLHDPHSAHCVLEPEEVPTAEELIGRGVEARDAALHTVK